MKLILFNSHTLWVVHVVIGLCYRPGTVLGQAIILEGIRDVKDANGVVANSLEVYLTFCMRLCPNFVGVFWKCAGNGFVNIAGNIFARYMLLAYSFSSFD